MNTLGFGRHYIVDAFSLDKTKLADAEYFKNEISNLCKKWLKATDNSTMFVCEHKGKNTGTENTDTESDLGLSLALITSASQVILHNYAPEEMLSISVFSSTRFPMQSIWTEFKKDLNIGRYEINMVNRCSLIDESIAEKQLTGAWQYNLARLSR